MVEGSTLSIATAVVPIHSNQSALLIVGGCVRLSGTLQINVNGPYVKSGATIEKTLFHSSCVEGGFSSIEMTSSDNPCLKGTAADTSYKADSTLMVFGTMVDTCTFSSANIDGFSRPLSILLILLGGFILM